MTLKTIMFGTVFFWQWEEDFIIWLQGIGGTGAFQKFLVALNNFFSFLGEEYFAILVMGIVYWGIDKKKGEKLGLAVISSMVINTLIKNRFKRLRPWLSSDDIVLHREVTGYSFPSAHSSSASSLYSTLMAEFREHKWVKIPAIILPVLIALSRCYLGAHWPTDVLTGLLLGVVSCVVIELLMPRIKNKYILYLIFLIVGATGFFYCTTEDFFTNYGLLLGFSGAMLFDEKCVKFENTNKKLYMVLRTLFGGLVFVVTNLVLKTLIGSIFPEETFLYLLMRTVRYACVSFVTIGVSPFMFKPAEKKLDKIFKFN